jgi:flavin-dependent dehydrogenase
MTREDLDGSDWDALVVGAGPAGSIAARELARLGARTLLVERAAFPRWKVCGACLNGRALASLRGAGLSTWLGLSSESTPHPTLPLKGGGLDSLNIRGNKNPPPLRGRVGWGVDPPLHPVPLETFELRSRGRTVSLPLPEGVALSRARLDAALAAAAAEEGASVAFETYAHVGDIHEGSRSVRLVHHGQTAHVTARVVLDAAGLGGNCLPAGATPRVRVAQRSRVGAGCVVADVPGAYHPGTIFMAAGRHGYVGLVRVEDGSLNIAAAFDAEFVRSSGSPSSAAAAILAQAGFPPVPALESADWRGTPALTRRTSPLGDERLFLLGDAAGYVEPFTGEGMAWAIASGMALAPIALRATEGWTPILVREWSALHRRIVGRRQLVCRAASVALRRPWLVPLAFGALARWPVASGYLLRHLNAPSPLPASCP